MIRPKPDRCGYDGWTCSGIPTVEEVYVRARLVCDPEFGRTYSPAEVSSTDPETGSEVVVLVDNMEPDWTESPWSEVPPESRWNWVDNYLNIPAKVAGMVMTVDRLLDMRGSSSSYIVNPPELECVGDSGPFAESGFVDAFYKYESAGVGIDARAGGCEWIDGSSDPPTSSVASYVPVASSNICFVGDEDTGSAIVKSECQLEPAALEPMLDVWFDPVDIEFNTAFDAAMDGMLIGLGMLNLWKDWVNDRIAYLLGRLKGTNDMRWMLRLLQKQSACDQFQIYVAGGDPTAWGNGTPTASYGVTGGTAIINGVGLGVSARPNIGTAPVSVGVLIRAMDTVQRTGQYTDLEAIIVTDNDVGGGNQRGEDLAVIGIGCVTPVAGNGYTVNIITQERCSIDVDLVRTVEDGVLKRTGDTAMPYEVLETAPCDDDVGGGGETPSGEESEGENDPEE